MTKDSIFNYCKASCEMAEVSLVGRSLYYSLWNEFVPYIVLAKPMTDLCWVCQQNSQLIIDKQGEELEVMSDTVQAHLNHLKLAITEQKYYQEQCKLAADHHSTRSANRALSKNKPCSFDGVAHYSWDYAQQTHYPHNPFQPGPIYFKTPRKCGIFGVCNDGINLQMNYSIDEVMATGKGANATISYFHHYLTNYGIGEKRGLFHADNCSGIAFFRVQKIVQGKP